MGDQEPLVRKQYLDLYADYYGSGAETAAKRKTAAKREIAAQQTINYLSSVIGSHRFDRVLDVGAGDGNVLSELDHRGVAQELYALEISPSGVEAIQARQLAGLKDARLFDGYHIPYPDKHFDLAVAIHVLEHVEHERLLLREMRRVARRVYVEVPLEHGIGVRRSIANGRQFGHINFYTPATLRNLLESSGLEVTDCRVGASSLRYEQHVSGRLRGYLKGAVRRLALKAFPRTAPWFIVYNGFAYCDCG
jgi:SAM-dependent methyltransferase